MGEDVQLFANLNLILAKLTKHEVKATTLERSPLCRRATLEEEERKSLKVG